MPLVLTNLDQKESWQPVEFKLPAQKGFINQKFEALLIIPEKDDYEEVVKEKTVLECLDMWLVKARGIQAEPGNAKEMEFTPELKQTLIKNQIIALALWESHKNAMAGGRIKN